MIRRLSVVALLLAAGLVAGIVLSGLTDHRDEVLTDDEKAEQFSMMICVSRAKGDRIGLDL